MKTTVIVKKNIKLKRSYDKVCGPHGVQHSVSMRVCPHNFVHPKDWPFFDWENIGAIAKLDQPCEEDYFCPKGCFKLNIIYP